MPEFDFIVVGAGPAGCMLAAELTSRTDATVLLVEAGSPTPAVGRRPAEYLSSFQGELDWGLQTTRQPRLAGRSLPWPRGRGLGGSSLINAMIWSPPTASDLQTLIDHTGSAWTLASLEADLRNVEARIQPESPRWLSEAARRFLRAAEKLQERFDGQAMVYRRSNRFGRRRTAGDLLHEAVRQDRRAGGEVAVHVLSAMVDSIVWDGDRAAGVQLVRDGGGTPETIASRHGVVICAGTIHSPAVLMRSGVGPAEGLADQSIPRRLDREEVGGNLADHLVMPVIWSIPKAARFPGAWSVADLARWTYGGTGPVASNLAEVGGFFAIPKSDGALAGRESVSRIQLHVTPTDYLRHPHPQASAALTIAVTDSAPRSRGWIRLNSRQPLCPPAVEPNYLADPGDAAVLIAAVRFARQFAAETPLAGWCGPERLPGSKRQGGYELARAVARYTQTLYHPVGTCRLGNDPGAVVSADFQVRGTESLWVCDASVLPTLPAANPSALVFTLAQRLARDLARRL